MPDQTSQLFFESLAHAISHLFLLIISIILIWLSITLMSSCLCSELHISFIVPDVVDAAWRLKSHWLNFVTHTK